MHYLQAIAQYPASSEQERADKQTILHFARAFPDTVLTRENTVAHLTSSGFIMNRALNRVLMVHHNLYQTWAWTGGHADGDTDLLAVALREAEEETGARGIQPLCTDILSLDILPVWAHEKRGVYVGTHLHLSAAYVLLAPEDTPLRSCPDENSGVRWIRVDDLSRYSNEAQVLPIYNKLITRARAHG